MAVAPGFIGNATDGIGQGLAFVLPQSNTEKYAMQLGQQHAADLRAAAAAQQKQQEALQAQYAKDYAAHKVPEYWSVAGKPINDAFNSYQQKAASMLATTGKSPFNDPALQKYYNDNVLLPARKSKEIEQAGIKGTAMIAADHDGRLTEDSKKAYLDWWDRAQKNPSSVFNEPIPQLQGTPSGIDDFNKLIKPIHIEQGNGTVKTIVPDTSSMMQQAYVNSADPRWNNLKKTKYGIDPELGDIGSVYDKNGKRVWYTNAQATDHIAQQMLDNPTEAHNAEILTKLGITPDAPYAKEKLQAAITKQNAGYGQFISDAGKYGTSLVNKSRVVTPDKYNEHLWDRYNFDQAHPKTPKVEDTVQIGNQGSNVPVVQQTVSDGKVVPQTIGKDENGNPITANSTTAKEAGASLFSSNFDNQSVTVTPSNYVDLKNGHSIKNTEPFNMQVGTIKMVPVFKGLNTTDSRNGAEISLRQLKEIVDGKHPYFKMSNIEFKPYAYGERNINDAKGNVIPQGVAIPYDALRGNKKIPTQNFDKTVSQFNELLASPDFKAMDAKERLNFLQQTFNIK